VLNEGDVVKVLFIEVPANVSELSLLAEKLPVDSFRVIEPKHIDGSQTVQIFIELAKVIVPSAIAAISTYLVASKNKDSVKMKYDDGNIVVEIYGKLNDKKLQDNQLYKNLLQLIASMLEGERKSEADC
jgi:hypothetical protein